MSDDDDTMNGVEIIQHIMRVKNCSFEVAEKELVAAFREGKLKSLTPIPADIQAMIDANN